MSKKPKNPQAEKPNEVCERDEFQTPNYATELLVPFIPKNIGVIWECAAGEGKMVKVFFSHGYAVAATDLSQGINFLVDDDYPEYDAIITNPPFSLKKKFYIQCLKYNLPFALLIPADYTGWVIEAVEKFGCEKIIPTRRIDYITPRILKRIWEGETWKIVKKEWNLDSVKMSEYAESYPHEWSAYLSQNKRFCFDSIYSAPAELLRKYSSSYYHSMWLTYKFGLGRSETFVELTSRQKDNI